MQRHIGFLSSHHDHTYRTVIILAIMTEEHHNRAELAKYLSDFVDRVWNVMEVCTVKSRDLAQASDLQIHRRKYTKEA